MRIPHPKLNYANVIATVALFVALGGAAVAASLPKHSVGPRQLKKGAVTTKALRRHAVTSGKIAPRAVTAGKLGPFAVLPGNLGNGIVGTEKLGNAAVIASKIKNGVVTTNKLDNGAVTTAKLGDGSVSSAKLDNGAVNSSKLGESSVSVSKLGKGVIGQLQTGQLESGQTLRGSFAIGGSGPTPGNREGFGAISYQLPLQHAPGATVLLPGQTSANCNGLGSDNQTPQAAGGNVCIYVNGYANVDTSEPPHTFNDSRVGVGLSVKGNDTGEPFVAYGLWAVTAP